MADFVADTDLNMRWQGLDLAEGTPFDRQPIAAGTAFTVPDDLADEFLAEFGPRPSSDADRPRADVRDVARIAGLRRV